MKLNPDCVRDILIDVENKSTFNNDVQYLGPEDMKALNKYTYDEIMYHIRQCSENGFFIGKVEYYMDGGCSIVDLSPSAHEFLANIRQDNNWHKTKTIASKVGSHSISALKEIAIQVISNAISSNVN
ncbi:DUF2513 domain-containing protein [Streptococcus uberis]|uniref:DUF2513 domain-containing protein n=1 Tax=Streptococcus uberis TaxID=1349 RepID=UPI0020BF01B0|nr:DUF2513 domain-containing protein [Streptococcus uberis]